MKTETQHPLSRSFPLGRTIITPRALHCLHPVDAWTGMQRHAGRDWGDCDPEDARANDEALVNGARLVSVYHDRHGVQFLVITEADRSASTILLPEDY